MQADKLKSPKSQTSNQRPNSGAEDGGDDVPSHLKKMHAKMGGKHMHIHSHGMGHTTHHVGEDGQAGGPDEHQDDESLAAHVKGTMGDGDGDDAQTSPYGKQSPLPDLSGLVS